MNALFFLPILLAASAAQAEAPKPQMACRAVYRSLDAANNTIERSALVPVKIRAAALIKHEGDFEGKNFTLTETPGSNDLFGQITAGPDYTKGTVVRGASDSQGRFTATEVVGPTIYRLECDRVRND